jgi:hypothetical protein
MPVAQLTFSLLIFVSTLFQVNAQSKTPKYSNEFLSLGIGARALGMGGSQVGIVDDVTSGYWNPAGLVHIKNKYEVGLMHAEYFAGIAKFDYLGFATQLDSTSTLGVSAIRFGVDDIPDTRFLYDAQGRINYDNITFFSAADYAFLLSYSRKNLLIKGLNIGANFKVVHRVVGKFANAWGFGLDLGAQYNYKGWMIGVMGRDITGTFNSWSHNSEMVKEVYSATGNEIPANSIEITLPKLIIGIGKEFQVWKLGVLPTVDFNVTFDGKRNVVLKSEVVSADPTVGIELNYKKFIFLRGGTRNIQKVEGKTSFEPNFGLGVKIDRLYIDYAMTDVGDVSQSLYSHIFSLKYGLTR